MPGREPPRLLILGGTGEGRLLAEELARRFGPRLAVISSLAGRTSAPAALAGGVRTGGFGGAAGLARFLREQRIAAIVDAAHPFAATIHAAAREAAAVAGVARLVLGRRPWTAEPGDRWFEAADARAAAALLPDLGRRVWLTVGSKDLPAFAAVPDTWFLVRRIEAGPLPLSDAVAIAGRGPFTVADEAAVIARHRIDVIVSKASGGGATSAKLIAARAAGIPVVMIRRPPAEPGCTVYDVAAATDWVTVKLGLEEVRRDSR